MLRYAITSRTLFPGIAPSSDKARVPPSSRPDREVWDPQIFALLHQTARWASDGIDYIQLREKDLPTSSLAALARQILAAIRDTPTKLLINSRCDIAIATSAHGVHLTSVPGELTPEQVRELYRFAGLPRPVISVSCHTLAKVEQARRTGADIVLFGPVFEKNVAGQLITRGQGLDALRHACKIAAPAAVFALGGVTYENAPDCLHAGATGIAGIRLFHDL